jgi:hypothetical protein
MRFPKLWPTRNLKAHNHTEKNIIYDHFSLLIRPFSCPNWLYQPCFLFVFGLLVLTKPSFDNQTISIQTALQRDSVIMFFNLSMAWFSFTIDGYRRTFWFPPEVCRKCNSDILKCWKQISSVVTNDKWSNKSNLFWGISMGKVLPNWKMCLKFSEVFG